MATFKKAHKKTTGKTKPAGADARAKAERLSKSLSESAQQIWQAGVGAFGRAQSEGSKLFEGLVKEGLNLEQTARKFAGGRADVVRDAVETGVGQARDRAADTWDRLEKVFEERVQRALTRLGVPGSSDLSELSERVEALTRELRRQSGSGKSAGATATANATATKRAVRKAPTARKAAASAAKPKTTATKMAKRKAAPAARTARNAAAKPAPARASGKKAPAKTGRRAATRPATNARARKTAVSSNATPDAPGRSKD